MDYRRKYLKYRAKCELLRLAQKGGNGIPIISFNVLNSSRYVVKMLFLAHSKEFEKLNIPNIKGVIEKLSIMEESRFLTYRIEILMHIVNLWIDAKKIVCLQEVDPDFLMLLKQRFGDRVYHTVEPDINKTYRQRQLVDSIKHEHRVIIVPQDYEVMNSGELLFSNNVAKKNGLFTTIRYNDRIFCIINVHFHYRSELEDFDRYVETIMNAVQSNKFIITGDFNTPLDDPKMEHFITQMKNDHPIEVNEYNLAPDSFTSDDTRVKIGEPVTRVVIDHIITSGFAPSQLNIIDTIDDIEIYYDVPKMLKLFTIDELNTLSPEKLMEKLFIKRFISDHKPVECILVYN